MSPYQLHSVPWEMSAAPPTPCYLPLPNPLGTCLWPRCTSSGPCRGPGRPPSPLPPARSSETLFPEGALYSSFIFQGSANKFLPNCPQTKKVHISALKVTGGIADQAWHICRLPPVLPTICSHGHPLRSSPPPAPKAIHPSSPLLS